MMTDPTALEVFFADLLLPLHHSNVRRNVHYFALGPDDAMASYWAPPTSRAAGGMERLRIGEGDAAALLARLADYWTERGEPLLAQLQPDMEALLQNLFDSDDDPDDASATVPVTVYPLF
jgi:hypothetical protein